MISIFLLQWQRFRREPLLVLSFFGLTIFFVFFLAGSANTNQITVQTYLEDDVSQSSADEWLTVLNQSETFRFELTEEEDARSAVMNGEASLALQLRNDNYRILVTVDDQNYQLVNGYVQQVFQEELRLAEVESSLESVEIRDTIAQELEEPVLTVTSDTIAGDDNGFLYDARLHTLFGMTLFFSVYTMMFSLTNVAEEKRLGTWDRLIVSPLRKWEVYLGHLLYCFLIGFLQILTIFLFFEYVFQFNIGANFGAILLIIACYAFAIVSVGMLLIGLVRTTQQLQAVIPIVATAMAMIGGAFWPVEIVSNEIMIILSKAMPIFYGMEALKGVAYLDQGILEISEPLAIMFLFGVFSMGIGINLMERRAS
ncbi:ABC transporter permease [Salipaludibacillus daqingensis]|uniref:ABC transporter permease n=1 Tax=Salipaludibacillus daqingensis TaxID=3041001 RepID=UPI00247468DC|nr:ABC transporter permease [Salipaludibacillus daqingensis]